MTCEIRATVKYGKGFEDTWLGFHGTAEEVREGIIQAFDLDRDSLEGVSLSEVILAATNQAHALGNLGAGLKAESVSRARDTTPATQTSRSDAWKAARQESSAPEEPKENPMLSVIEAEQTVPGLKRLYAENPDAFKDPAVMAAWRAKGKALQAAA